MLEKTRGIVLKVTDYGDTSVIVQIFTERFGMQSYLVQGAKRPKAKLPANMMRSLQLLDLVVRRRPGNSLQRISEMSLSPPFLSIPYDVVKSSVALFINEMLYKSLRHQGPDEALFQFVYYAVSWLDSVERVPPGFHLFFLLRLSRFLGFHPSRRNEGDRFFDLKDGIYQRFEPNHPLTLSEPYVTLFSELTIATFDALPSFRLSREQRRFLLEKMVEYFQLHIDNFGEVKSRTVLEEVFS